MLCSTGIQVAYLAIKISQLPAEVSGKLAGPVSKSAVFSKYPVK